MGQRIKGPEGMTNHVLYRVLLNGEVKAMIQGKVRRFRDLDHSVPRTGSSSSTLVRSLLHGHWIFALRNSHFGPT